MRQGIFLFDKAQNLTASISPRGMKENYQKLVLNGLITGIASSHYNSKVSEAFYYGARDPEDPEQFWLYKIIKKQKEDDLSVLNGVHILFDDLKGVVVRDKRPTNQIPSQVMGALLEGTGWSVGVSTATHRNSGNFYYESALSCLFSAAEKWQFEFRPRITFSNGKITGKFIDLYDRMSDDYGKWFEYGDKLLDVAAEESYETLFTAYIGRGKGEEIFDDSGEATGGFGRKIKFDAIEWKKTSGNPVDKPTGQDYVEIPEATAAYGYPDGTPRIGIIDFDDIEDPQALLQATYDYAVENSRPKLQLKSSALWTGKVELGETVAIIRPDLGIRYKTRVFSVARDFLNAEVKSFELGDKIRHSESQRIRAEEKKQKARDELVESRMATVIREVTNSYFNEDAHEYGLKVGNEYGLPAGTYSFDKPIDQNPTKVLYTGAGKALIANSKNPNGEWEWRTAVTADGIAGQEIVANSITANKLASDVGQSLDLSSNTFINQAVKDVFNGEIMTVSTAAPESPTAGRLWLDTSVSPNLIKRWDGSKWVTVSDLTQLEELVASKASQSDLDSQIANVVSSIQASLESEISQTNSTFNIKFSETIGAINAAGDRISALSSEIETNIRFTADGIELGKSTNPVSVKILPDRVSFSEGGQEVAYFSNNKLYVTDIHVLTSLRIGDFAFFPRPSGNLSFRKVT